MGCSFCQITKNLVAISVVSLFTAFAFIMIVIIVFAIPLILR